MSFEIATDTLIESSPGLSMGPGNVMRFYKNTAVPEDSWERRCAIMIWDPKESKVPFAVPAHWHAEHDEYLSVLEGYAFVTLGVGSSAKKIKMVPGMEPVCAHKRVTHAIQEPTDAKLVLKESTSFGESRRKEVFFRSIATETGTPPGAMAMLRAVYEGDGYFSTGWMGVDRVLMAMLGPVSNLFAGPPPELLDEDEFLNKKT